MTQQQITQVLILWVAVTGILSLLNKYVLATRYPRVSAFLSSVCAVSPGDIAKLVEQFVVLFAPSAALPAVVASSKVDAANGSRAILARSVPPEATPTNPETPTAKKSDPPKN